METICDLINSTDVFLDGELVPKLSPWAQAIFVVADIGIFFTATLGNIIVLLSVMMYRKLRTPTNMFVASLSVADLFVSFICIPVDLAIALGFQDNTSIWACLAGSSLIMTLSVVSVLHLLIIAYDRYLAIKEPFNYHMIMSNTRICLSIAIAWTIGGFFTIASLGGLNNIECYNRDYCDMMWIQKRGLRTAAIFMAGIIPVNLMSHMYFKMYKLARNARKQIEMTDNVRKTTMEGQGGTRPKGRSMKKDLKAAKTVALIMGCFIVAWTPASVLSIIDLFVTVSPELTFKLYPYQLIFFHMAFANSAMNPIIYAFRNKDFRYMFLTILGKVFRCKCWSNRVSVAAEQSLDQVASVRASVMVPSIVVSHKEHDENEHNGVKKLEGLPKID